MHVRELTKAARPGFKSEKWRNIYWLERKIQLRSGPAGPGRFASRFVWPSRDVAETQANKTLSRPNPDWGHVRYLGAVKE